MKTIKILYFLVVLLSFKTLAVSDKGVKISLGWGIQENY